MTGRPARSAPTRTYSMLIGARARLPAAGTLYAQPSRTSFTQCLGVRAAGRGSAGRRARRAHPPLNRVAQGAVRALPTNWGLLAPVPRSTCARGAVRAAGTSAEESLPGPSRRTPSWPAGSLALSTPGGLSAELAPGCGGAPALAAGVALVYALREGYQRRNTIACLSPSEEISTEPELEEFVELRPDRAALAPHRSQRRGGGPIDG